MRRLPYFKFGSPTVCTYCGDSPEGLDHVLCVASQMIMRKVGDKTGYGPTTPACSGCNSVILNSRSFGSFMERCEFVSKRLSKKADPVYWSEAQLSEFNYTLRTYIENENRRRLWYRFRADWFQSPDFFKNLEPVLWQECLDPSHPSFSSELYSFFKTTISMVRQAINKE